MKRIIVCIMLIVLCTSVFTACDGDSSGGTAATTTTTTKKVTTTTTEEKPYMSESEAISLAKSYIKDRFSQYSPVVIGEIRTFSETDNYWQVSVKGHYWKTDKYGNNAKSQNFYDQVTVYKSTGRCKGLA